MLGDATDPLGVFFHVIAKVSVLYLNTSGGKRRQNESRGTPECPQDDRGAHSLWSKIVLRELCIVCHPATIHEGWHHRNALCLLKKTLAIHRIPLRVQAEIDTGACILRALHNNK